MTDAQTVLEVIACSVSDALAAEQGGANRLEVVRDLKHGGQTPSLKLVSEIMRAVKLPVRVMLRESSGFEASSEEEIESLCGAAKQFAALGVDGFVVGFLKDHEVNIELTGRVLASAPNIRSTFHHAFEAARDQLQALTDIRCLAQVDRILSSGGAGELKRRVQRLENYAAAASPEMTILAGGGIDSDAIQEIARTTPIREFHVGRAARSGFQVEGDVQSGLVSNLVGILRGL